MAHPTYEQLLAHLEGRTPVESADELRRHLETCLQCTEELAGWRRTVQRLESYDWPARQETPALARVIVKWAAAAVLVLGLGFGVGRLSFPSAAVTQQAVAAAVKQQLREQLRTELLAVLTTPDPGAAEPFRTQLRQELAAALDREPSTSDQSRQVQALLASFEQKQDENQRLVLALIARVRQQHEADYFSLRHDLETAASVADNNLRENEQQLNHLAATLLAKAQ